MRGRQREGERERETRVEKCEEGKYGAVEELLIIFHPTFFTLPENMSRLDLPRLRAWQDNGRRATRRLLY